MRLSSRKKLRFSGKNLWEVLHDDGPELEIHDPYQVSEVTLHGQQVPFQRGAHAEWNDRGRVVVAQAHRIGHALVEEALPLPEVPLSGF